jgi:hypothetical protein
MGWALRELPPPSARSESGVDVSVVVEPAGAQHAAGTGSEDHLNISVERALDTKDTGGWKATMLSF